MPKTATTEDTEMKSENTEKKSVRNKPKSSAVAANAQELEERLKRALADYHNLEKRVDEERKLLSKLSASLLIEKILPILDNLQQAQTHLKDEGLEMVIRQFEDILRSEGLEEIPAEGSQFDPHLHEAVETQDGENDNMVARVLAKGYKIDNTVIRPAKVIVTKRQVGDEQSSLGQENSEISAIKD